MPLRPEPENVMDIVQDILRRLTDLESARSANATAISQGATTVVDPATGNVLIRIGKLSDGTFGIEQRRTDGSYAKLNLT